MGRTEALVPPGRTEDFETLSLAALRYRTVRLWFVGVGLFALVFTYVAPTVAPLLLLPAPATTVTSLPELAFPSVVFPELAPPPPVRVGKPAPVAHVRLAPQPRQTLGTQPQEARTPAPAEARTPRESASATVPVVTNRYSLVPAEKPATTKADPFENVPVVDDTIGLTPELPADAVVPATAAPAVESAPAAAEPAPALTEADPAAAGSTSYPATDEETPRGFLDDPEPVAPPAAEEAAATETDGAAEATPAAPETRVEPAEAAPAPADETTVAATAAPAAAAPPETVASPAGDAATSAEAEVESWVVTLAPELDNAVELAASESEAAITVNGFLTNRQLTKFRGIEIKGGSGSDRLRIDSTARFIERPVTFDGGAGHDGVEGPSTDTTWTIDGEDSGSVAGVAFSGVEDLQGAADNEDTFVFEEGGSVSGVVDGGAGGNDRLFFASSYASAEAASTGEGSGTVTVDGVVIRFAGLEQPALNAEGAPISAGGAGAIDAATLAAVAEQAAELWSSRAGPGEAAPPGGITFAIADLPGAAIAQSYGRVVTIDSDAAGWGWYVEGSPVQTGRMDLLTAVLHGLGRASGLDESAAAVAPEMAGTLAPRDGGDPAVGVAAPAAEPEAWDVRLSDADNLLLLTFALGLIGLSLNGLNESRSISTVSGLTIHGGSGNDLLEITSLPDTLGIPIFFAGNGGIDTIRGPPLDVVWSVTGPGSGTVGAVAFAGVEQLEGAAANEDTFVFEGTGSLSGTVDGGAGGFDTLVIASGSFAHTIYTITGPDSGTIARDADLITYVGLEPTVDGTGGAKTFTGTAGADTITIDTSGTSLVVDIGVGEDLVLTAPGSVTSLTIDAGAGDDTIAVPDTAGTWELDGLGSGTWTPVTGIGFSFTGVENLVGAPTAAETYRFLDGGGLEGAITDGTGELTVGVDAFGSITGDFAFGTTTYSGIDTGGGTITDANVITVSGTTGAIFFGLRAGSVEVGINGTAGNWGIAIATDGTEVWHAWAGTFTNPAITGIGELDLSAASFSIAVNTASPTGGEAIDFDSTNLAVGPVTLIQGAASTAVSANDVRIELGEFVYAEGTLSFELGEDREVEIGTSGLDPATETALSNAVTAVGGGVTFADGTISNVPVSTVTFGLTSATIFVGRNPVGFDLFDSPVDEWEGLGADGITAVGIDLGFAMATVQADQLAALLPSFLALKATVSAIDLVGLVPGLELEIENAALAYNRSGTVNGQTGSAAWVQWAASFPDPNDDDTDPPAGLPLVVPGTSSAPVYIDMDEPTLAVSADDALLSFGGFVTIAGGFSYVSGGTADVDVTTTGTPADGTTTVEVATTLIGFSGASVFAGAPGDFDPDVTGFACADVQASTAVGICASGIDIGIILASPTDADSILPDFLAVQGEVGSATPVGLPAGFQLELKTVTFGVNQGGPVLDGPPSTGTPIPGSNAFVDWSAFDGGNGFEVPTGTSTSVTIDLDEATVGVAAAQVLLNIGGFVAIAGSFSFERGATETVEIGIDGLGALESSFSAAVTAAGGTLAYDDSTGVLSGVDVTTTLIGIGGASLFIGYVEERFEFDEPFDCDALADAYGFCVDGIDVGLALATLLDPAAIAGWTLPDFLAARVDIGSPQLLGLPASIFDFDFDGLHLAFNRSGALTQGTTAVAGSRAWVRWGASFPDPDGEDTGAPAGLPVKTGPGEDAATQYIDLDDPLLQLAADRVQLVIGGFFTVAGGFSFEQGGLETVTVETSLPEASEAAFEAAVNGVPGLAYDEGTITGLGVTTTLIGIRNAAVFAGYNPDGFTIGDEFTCSDLEAAGAAVGFCADGIEVGIALASLTDPQLIPGYALPSFLAAKISIDDIELLGLPTDVFDLDFEGIAVTLNRGGAIATSSGTTRTPIAGSNSWIDWAASFPGTPAGLPIGMDSGTQYLDLEDPIIGISAESVQLVIGDFFTVRGSFSFVQGGLETVTVQTSLPAASEGAFESAVNGVAGLAYDDGAVTGLGVTTTLIGIGNAAVFAGYNPDGFTIGDEFTCDELETADRAIGLCADGIQVGIALASLTDPALIPGYALPNFVAAKVTVEDIELLGLPTDVFDLDFEGIAVVLNRGGQVATRTGTTRTPIAGSNSWVDWAASFPDPDGDDTGVPAGLPVTTGPGEDAVTQYIDVEDPIIGISAERVQLVISDFFTVRGSFSFVQGGLETVTVETSLPAASEAAFASAVGGVTGLTYDDGTITGVGVTTTLIGIGNAAVFAGYNPDGFTIGDDFTCSELETADKAIGLCADGIEVGIALASLTDPELIPGYALPNFVAAKVTVEDIELLGLPTEFFDLDFAGIAVVLNRGGQVATRTGVARTPITGSNSWIDWEASFPDPDGGDTGTPAGLPVETGAGTTQYIDLDDPIIGVSADLVTLKISDFVYITGGFAFEQGNLEELVIDTFGLTALERTNLGAALGGGASMDDDGRITGWTVPTTTIGISDASVFVGYSPDGFEVEDGKFTGVSSNAYGLLATGINVGMVMASVDRTMVTGAFRLPGFFGLQAEIGSVTFPGLPTDLFDLSFAEIELRYNSGGRVTGTVNGTAHVDWAATAGSPDGVEVSTGTSTDPVFVAHEDAIVGVAAETVELTIGDFVHVAGSFSFQQGADELLDVQTIGLSTAELTALGTALTTSGSGATINGRLIENLPAITTLIGIGGATVFAGYAPNGFPEDPTFTCAELEAADALGFCADGIDFGMVVAKTPPGVAGTFVFPTFWALRGVIANVVPLGLPDEFELRFEGLGVSVNGRGALLGGAPGAEVFVDWEASFPEGDGDPADPPAGLPVPTGPDDEDRVFIDFDGPIIGVSADLVVLSISDFVHISGGFAFEKGGQAFVDVDIAGVTVTQVDDVSVTTTTIGISDASLFVGYNPNATGTGGTSFDLGEDDPATDEREDRILSADDLDDEATGLLLSDIDLGLVMARADLPMLQNAQAMLYTFPSFWAVKARIGDFALLNLLPSSIGFELEGIQLIVNGGGAAVGPTPGQATINWLDSFPAGPDPETEPAGFPVATGTTTEPVLIDFAGPVIGISATRVVLSISDFVHISGGFSFIKGATLTVDVQTNTTITSTPALGAIPIVQPPPPLGGVWRSENGSMLFDVPVETIQIGIHAASLFIGYNPNESGGTFDVGDDGILTQDELSDDAIGFLASNVNLGMVLSTIQPTLQLRALGLLPRFTTIKAFVGQVAVVGLEDFLTLELNGVRVEVNTGGQWAGAPSPAPPAILWSEFDGGDGYAVSTGEGNPPVVLDMEGYLIGGGADLFVLGISEFVHLRGAAYFEMGAVATVPLSSVIDLGVFGAAIPPAVAAVAGLTEKELRFLNFGAEDVYAFVGVGGPSWLTEDPDDLTSDIRFECDPTQVGSGCVPDDCAADDKPLDGFADAEANGECRAVRNVNAIGIAVADLDFAFAMGTPVLQADPTRYYTLRASIDEAGLVGLEDAGLTAVLKGVSLEVNISTVPAFPAFPLLPTIDWEQYALDHGCTEDDIAAAAKGESIGAACKPFGVKTGRIVNTEDGTPGGTQCDPEVDDPCIRVDVTEDFFYDGLFIRAAVRLAKIDVFGVLVARGSLAFELGGTVDVQLVDGTTVEDVTTMTIGGADLFAFVGVDGPHWTEDPITGAIVYTQDGTPVADGGTPCNPDVAGPCELVRNPNAVGLALTDLDFGLFVGAKLDPENPAGFVAANITIDSIELVGIPGLDAEAILAVALNLGFVLGTGGVRASAIDFKASFTYDELFDENDNEIPGETGLQGYRLETGDPANPMIIDFDRTFIEVQLAGYIEITDVARVDGIFFLGIDLDAGAEEFRLLALGEMTIGPDIGADEPILSIGAVGVLILNSTGVAGDFTVNLEINLSPLEVDVYARVIFNSSGGDMTLRLPDELYDYLTRLGTATVEGVANPGPLAEDLLERLIDCPGGPVGERRCLTISGRVPNLVSGTGPDVDTIDWLLGNGGMPNENDPGSYVVAVVDGQLTLVGFASASLFGAIAISTSGFELIANLNFQLGPNPSVSLMVDVSAIAELSSAGFFLHASVDIEANLLSVFDLDVAGTVTIDTRGTTTSFQLALSGSVSILRVVSLSGSLVIVVGGPLGEDAWYIGASLSAQFGPLGLSASGFIASWGSFSFTLTGFIDLTFAGTGIEGSLTAHVSYCARPGGDLFSRTCRDDIQNELLATGTLSTATIALIQSFQTSSGPLNAGGRSFLAALSGRVAIKIIGITLAGVRVDLEVGGALGDRVSVRATFTVETIFGDISRTVTIATFQLPTQLINANPVPPVLATNDGGVLKLNVGDRAGERAVAVGEIDEAYMIMQSGTTVTVSAFGWTETHTGITRIEGFFGDGDDELVIFTEVTAPVHATGGAGNDRLATAGSGVATLSGDEGDDVLIGGQVGDTLDGGLGDDFLDGSAGVDSLTGGPSTISAGESDDDTFFGYGSQLAGETLATGAGYDRMEVIGLDTGETITLGAVSGRLELDYDAGGPQTALNLTGIEELLLRLSGGDDLTVSGAVDTVGLEVLTITSAPFRPQVFATQEDVDAGLAATVGAELVTELVSSDSITVSLLGGDDTVLITAASTPAPATFAQGDGVFEIVAGVDEHGNPISGSPAPGGPVPTTSVNWVGHIVFTIANTGLAGNDYDVLTIQTVGGDDAAAIRSLLTDTTLDLGDGADQVVVGSTASCTAGSCTNVNGLLSGIDAPLDVIGGGGADTLDLDDTSDITGDTLVLTAALIDGLDLYDDGIAYSSIAELDIRLGGGGDAVRVQSTSAATTIEGRGGGETFDVSSDAPANLGSLDDIAGALTLDGGLGSDVATLSDFGDTTGDTGTLTSSSLTGFSPAAITYLGLETLHVDLGSAGDDLTMSSVHAGVTTVDAGGGSDDVALHSSPASATITINGDGGDDWIELQATAGAVTISGNDGDDTVELGSLASSDARTVSSGGTLDGISGAVSVNGNEPSASDWLYLDDTGDLSGENGTVTSSTVMGLGLGPVGVTYTGIEHLQIALGPSSTTIDVISTNGVGDVPSGTTDTVLLLGGGDDTVNVSSNAPANTGTVNAILGHLTIDGQGAGDTVNVSDWADAADNTGTLTSTNLTGLGMGPSGITYAGLEFLNIDLGTGSDDFTIVSTHGGQTTLDTRDGGDTVNVRSVAGHTIVTTGAGADLVLVSSLADAADGALSDPTGAVPGGDVNGIDGFLDIDAGAGADRLVVDDSGETADDIGRVTRDEISGLGTTVDSTNAPADPVHVITVRDAQDGTFTITVDGLTTAAIAFDAGQDVVRDAIVAALGVSAADVTVTRSPVLRTGGITYRITFVGGIAGQAGRDLGDLMIDDAALVSLPSGTASAVPTAMTDGRIRYVGFEDLDLELGTASDQLALDSTGAVTTVGGGDGDDVIDVETIDHATRIDGDGGDDTLTVNRQPTALPAIGNGIAALLTLDGGEDSDRIEIQLSSTGTSHIDVLDSGFVGTNRLVVWGSEGVDQFLLRRDLVALLNNQQSGGSYLNAEYVTYDSGIDSLIVNLLGGADGVAIDDNSAITTVNGGDGDDTFQVGQLFGDECASDTFEGVANACFDPAYIPPTMIDTTQGQLSNGISVDTTLNGGDGDDLFLVFRNRAVLNLNGEDDDDTFVIRTFLEEDSETQVVAGAGADTISYVTNSPVNVNGGDGFDTLFVIGTEADDSFVITAAGVYGSGRYVAFVAIERLGVDGAEGNDHITVLATPQGVDVEVYGGLGSDTIDVAGDAPVVAADDLTGHSGLITHSVESTLGTWDGRPVDGIAAEVADDDEPAIVITQSGGQTVVAESGGTDTYTIGLTRAPTTDVRVTVLTAELTPDQLDGRERTIQVSLDGVTWLSAVEILFTPGNWATQRTVHVRAQHDVAAENAQTSAIQHSVHGEISGTVGSAAAGTLTAAGAFAGHDLTGADVVITGGPGQGEVRRILSHTAGTLTLDGAWTTTPTGASTWQIRGIGAYDELPLNIVGVLVIDDDVSQVVIRQTGVDTVVGESGTADSYTVELSAAPAAAVEVRIAAHSDVCLSTASDANAGCGELVLTFTTSAWGPIAVIVNAKADTLVESFEYARLEHTVAGSVVGVVTVLVSDRHVPDVLITESDGSTHVAEGIGLQDSYTVVLAGDPGAETVTVTATSLPTITQYDPEDGTPRITRTELQVELSIDGGATWHTSVDLTFTTGDWNTAQTVLVRAVEDAVIDGRILQAFPDRARRVHGVQGSLYVDGGVSDFGYPLANFRPVLLPGETSFPLAITPNEAFDVIEGHAVDRLVVDNRDDVADRSMTLTSEAITGLGMSAAGIEYDDLEALDILLGSGPDEVLVLSTHTGTTTVETGAGDDAVDVVTIAGHTRLLLGDDDDTATVTDGGLLAGIDAQLLVSGGAGVDTTFVDDTGDTEDDLGTLTQTSLVGLDLVSAQSNNLYSLELGIGLTSVALHVLAHRPATPAAPALDLDVTLTLTAAQLAGLTAETLAALLQAALFPPVVNAPPGETVPGDDDRFATTGCGTDGTTGEPDSRCSTSVFAWASGRLFLIGFRGELLGLDVAFTATPAGPGTATDLLRTDGITYDTLETLDIALGGGDDRFNVRGTLPHTVLDTGPGDDVVFVSDAANLGALPTALTVAGRDLEVLHEAVLHGTVSYDDLVFDGSLDEIDGDLDIDAGAGSNTLAVSDHADPDADIGFVIDHDSITGLATGEIGYAAAGGDLAGQGAWTLLADAGMFGRGITVHLGTGSDSGTIDSVRGGANATSPFGATVTTVYGNEGADEITVDVPVVAGARLVVHGDVGDDTIDAATSSLPVVVFGDAGADTISGGTGNDQLFGDDGRVHYVRPAGAPGFDVVFGGDPDGSVLPAVLDTVFLTPDLLLTRDTTIGSGDTIDAGSGNDIVLAGRGSDTVHGDNGNDLLLGDFGRVATRLAGGFVDATLLPLSQAVATHPFEWLSTDSTNTADAAGDALHGDAGEDVILGQQGADTVTGGADDDDLTGGHNVVGGLDAGDVIDGGADHDVILGDNGTILRTGSAVSQLVRQLVGTTLASGVTAPAQLNPTGVETRQIVLFDHPGSPGTFGADTIAGGTGNDVIFGQMGNDTIQGDGAATSGATASLDQLVLVPSFDAAGDGDDYIEGGGGNDVIFGNLGQDDLIGGSSSLFGLGAPSLRPDGVDTIFGGSGTMVAQNHLGLTSDGGHARDADTILGDNGNVFRIVNGGGFRSFAYDTYPGALRIIIRSIQLLDYSPTGDVQYIQTNAASQANSALVAGANTNIGGGDFIRGESGDDVIHGQTGSDRLWGDGQDDDLYGESGYDWISGGAGDDGILGDDGLLLTSRNGVAEPLYGLAATTQAVLSLSRDNQTTTIYSTLALRKEADLEPFYIGHNDVLYGGLGDDWLHAGAGDDAVSGAEALAFYYGGDPLATLASLSAYYAVGNVLQHGFRPAQPEEFRWFNENDPWRKIMVAPGIDFLLNFVAGTTANPIDDGQDVLFGDTGHDWLVGGTNHDRLWGGYGDDLLQGDDNLDSTAGTADPLRNDTVDTRPTAPLFADIGYGGAGRDILIVNTAADRMFDWNGEFNSYFATFMPYGEPTVNRLLQPATVQFLYQVSRSDGADRTRPGAAARNGEPFGELGLVIQSDADWGDQQGGPADPQPGGRPNPRDNVSVGNVGVRTPGPAPLTATFTGGTMLAAAGRLDAGGDLVDATLPTLRVNGNADTTRTHGVVSELDDGPVRAFASVRYSADLGVTAGRILSEVEKAVARGQIHYSLRNGLLAKLKAAQTNVDRVRDAQAVKTLEQFIAQVRGNAGGRIDGALAARLVGWAQDLIARLR